MTDRELFNAIMHYEDFDRMPVAHSSGWPETLERWQGEGLPEGVSEHEFLNAAPMSDGIPVDAGLFPLFEEEDIEETEEYRIFRQADGVVCKDWKNRSCIPHFMDFLLKGPAEWPEYKKRLQPDPARLPDNLDEILDGLNKSDVPVVMGTGSLVGWLRNWMGVENAAMVGMVDPDFFAETVETISDLVCWCIDQVGPKVHIDAGWGWEDICFKTGPLVHPDIFNAYCVPGYRKISDRLRAYGCDLHVVDCDGMVEHLIPGWLEGGVNVMFPIEIGTWNADPMAIRRKYGKDLRIIGGINKLVLEKSKSEIDAEIARRKPLMAEGGFIPLPDHLITPGTPLENMQYYIEQIRALRF